ncbi:hypothetical protein AB0L06_29540 [Spirillospora sp. NPDC052269]
MVRGDHERAAFGEHHGPDGDVGFADRELGELQIDLAGAHRAQRVGELHTATSSAKIRQLNQWIRTSGEYDAVVDFNKAVADPSDPERLRPDFDSSDHKHPNGAGYRAMADAVNLADLR